MDEFLTYQQVLEHPDYAANVAAYGEVVAPGRPLATALMHVLWMCSLAQAEWDMSGNDVRAGVTSGVFYAAGLATEPVERESDVTMPWTYVVYETTRGYVVEFRELVGLRKFSVDYRSLDGPDVGAWEQALLERSYWRILQDPL